MSRDRCQTRTVSIPLGEDGWREAEDHIRKAFDGPHSPRQYVEWLVRNGYAQELLQEHPSHEFQNDECLRCGVNR